MTAYADFNDAVTVIREGARDYVVKPFEMDELVLRVGRVRDHVSMRRQMEAGGPKSSIGVQRKIRGESPAAKRLLERIAAAAASDFNVLINGETGTGKDLCARMIHERSRRAQKPFVAVCCAALPENLIESELFGHEKGAFTGADRERVGRFKAADGGTLFLDEVGEIPLAQQAKLLRAVETSTFEPVGSSQSVKTDIRLIAATNRDLAGAVASGKFRSDLYYRLNVIDIETPSLRSRRVDIPALVGDILAELAARQGRPVAEVDSCAFAALATYDFPGNVRELIHALERAVAISGSGAIRLEHLPPAIALASECTEGHPCAFDQACMQNANDAAAQVEPLAGATGRFEQQYVRRVLDKTGGHRGRAAELLGISRKNLWLRLRGDSDK
jgi:DNA-binding NtrC family response regulator